MKFTQLYMQIIALVKTKRHVRLFLESRNTPRESGDVRTCQTYIMIHDAYEDKQLFSVFYDDTNPEEKNRILKDIGLLKRKLGSPDKDILGKMEKYLEIYQGLINRTKQYKDLVFKMVIMQRNEHATSLSIESVDQKQAPIALFIDEDQPESYQDLVKLANGIKHVEKMAEEDDHMNILPD